MKVLLAEDNPVNQEVALGLLEMMDCTVTVVENGKEAVDAAAGDMFDLVLMDCQMPVMDGMEATRTIRAASNDNSKLPIVALTANNIEHARAACLAAGMDDLLGKPFRRQDLYSLLRRWDPAPKPAPMVEAKPATEDLPRASSLDLAPIDNLRALDPSGERNIVHRAITKFVDYSEGLVTQLAEGVGESDADEVSRLAHSLKSSSANLGATDLARQCAEIEKLAAVGRLPDDIDRRLEALLATHRHAKEDLLLLLEA